MQNFFSADETSGDVIVNLFGDSELDRDNGVVSHSIRVDFEDNLGGIGGNFFWFPVNNLFNLTLIIQHAMEVKS